LVMLLTPSYGELEIGILHDRTPIPRRTRNSAGFPRRKFA